jgi:hypothetical protein
MTIEHAEQVLIAIAIEIRTLHFGGSTKGVELHTRPELRVDGSNA